LRAASAAGINLIEGNRGLFDGSDARGTHSTAELAKALQAPVLLLINAAKVTRTAAAWVLGCRHLDPQVRIGGIILNRVHGARHERVLRDASKAHAKSPSSAPCRTLGAVPCLPSRHLGLVPPDEHPRPDELANGLRELLRGRADVDRIQALAAEVPPLPVHPAPLPDFPTRAESGLDF